MGARRGRLSAPLPALVLPAPSELRPSRGSFPRKPCQKGVLTQRPPKGLGPRRPTSGPSPPFHPLASRHLAASSLCQILDSSEEPPLGILAVLAKMGRAANSDMLLAEPLEAPRSAPRLARRAEGVSSGTSEHVYRVKNRASKSLIHSTQTQPDQSLGFAMMPRVIISRNVLVSPPSNHNRASPTCLQSRPTDVFFGPGHPSIHPSIKRCLGTTHPAT
jgi:hypothetical protein